MAGGVPTLQPAEELVRQSDARQPNESATYRKARKALLIEEIELRRHVARAAALRRALPPGGEVKGDYQFLGEASSVKGANPVPFVDLFGIRTPSWCTTGCTGQNARDHARCARPY